MHLLIVDDGRYVVEYLKHLLNWAKFGVNCIETTTNPSEARMLLDSDRFDVMITDIRMPEISGIDLLEHIHKRELKTKVIFCPAIPNLIMLKRRFASVRWIIF